MNQRIVFFLVLTITVASVGPVLARDPGTPAEPETTSGKSLISFKTDDRESIFGDRFTLKAGYKVWVAKWQAQTSASLSTSTQVNTDHPSAMNGPTVTGILKLQDGDWLNAMVLNFTWLHDGFDFAEQTTNGAHFFANRRDYTVTAGLAIWQGFGIFGGYYNSRQEFTSQPNVALSPLSFSRHSRTVDGPIFGVFGNVPVSERVAFYGNLAYAQLKFRGVCDSPIACAETDAAQGYMSEIGLNITGPRIWQIGTELQIGFRAQIIQKNFGINATGGPLNGSNQHPLHDLTYGPVLALNAVF